MALEPEPMTHGPCVANRLYQVLSMVFGLNGYKPMKRRVSAGSLEVFNIWAEAAGLRPAYRSLIKQVI